MKPTPQPSEPTKGAGLMIDPKVFEASDSKAMPAVIIGKAPQLIPEPIPNINPKPEGMPVTRQHPVQSLGDFYAAVESAPPEWLPSMLNKVVRQALQSGIWSSPENLVLSVQGFAKLPQ